MHSPNTFSTGKAGTIGASGQAIVTEKYSVGSAFHNQYGDRYALITVVCDNSFTLTVRGSSNSFASVSDTGASAGALLATFSGAAASALDGTAFYVRIAGMRFVLPVVYQAGGDNATVTIKYQTFS